MLIVKGDPIADREVRKRVMMNPVVIVQARMKSTRLPGKVLKEVLGKPLLEYQLERLRGIQCAKQIVIATSKDREDDPIEEFCHKHRVECFRGSEEDVLSRYYHAAKKYKADIVLRITADCPIFDPYLVDMVAAPLIDHYPQMDYMSNSLWRTYPRGLDVEIFTFKVLEEAYQKATRKFDREHVTPYIQRHCPRDRLGGYACAVGDYSYHRWTVDTPEDFELIEKIIEELYPKKPNFVMPDVIELLEKEHPEWMKINERIEQKEE